MEHGNNPNQAPARVPRLTDAEATALGVKLIERLARREGRDGIVARVMRAIGSVRHQTAGAIDAAKTLSRLSPEDARQLTSMAAEIVHGRDQGGAR